MYNLMVKSIYSSFMPMMYSKYAFEYFFNSKEQVISDVLVSLGISQEKAT